MVQLLKLPSEVTGDYVITLSFQTGKPDTMQQIPVISSGKWEDFFEELEKQMKRAFKSMKSWSYAH